MQEQLPRDTRERPAAADCGLLRRAFLLCLGTGPSLPWLGRSPDLRLLPLHPSPPLTGPLLVCTRGSAWVRERKGRVKSECILHQLGNLLTGISPASELRHGVGR